MSFDTNSKYKCVFRHSNLFPNIMLFGGSLLRSTHNISIAIFFFEVVLDFLIKIVLNVLLNIYFTTYYTCARMCNAYLSHIRPLTYNS